MIMIYFVIEINKTNENKVYFTLEYFHWIAA